MGNDDGGHKQRQGFKTIGLCRIGAGAPVFLPGQPVAWIGVVVTPLAPGLAHHAGLGQASTGNG